MTKGRDGRDYGAETTERLRWELDTYLPSELKATTHYRRRQSLLRQQREIQAELAARAGQ